ncbi:MAG: response regulator transcription factor [Gammaproteobacteria bacterium]|nr:response regulator transcription factor [Gammaproteobacteria bacterium]
MNNVRYRVLLADDHRIVRQGLRGLLEKAGHEVVGEAADGREAVSLAARLTPEIAVMDLSMPLVNGLDATREIRRTVPAIKVILLTMYSDKGYVLQALQSGANGYILKSQAAEDLIRAIAEVSAGKVYLSNGMSTNELLTSLRKRRTTDVLTPRERQILKLVGEGKSTKEISKLLEISYKTVDAHRNHIMLKLDIHEVAGLVRYAIRRGLLDP